MDAVIYVRRPAVDFAQVAPTTANSIEVLKVKQRFSSDFSTLCAWLCGVERGLKLSLSCVWVCTQSAAERRLSADLGHFMSLCPNVDMYLVLMW